MYNEPCVVTLIADTQKRVRRPKNLQPPNRRFFFIIWWLYWPS